MPRFSPAVAWLMGFAALAAGVANAPEGRRLTDEQFNAAVMDGRTPEEMRADLMSRLDDEVGRMQHVFKFDEGLCGEIRQGGERDIDHWFETVGKAREKYTIRPLAPDQLVDAQTEMTQLHLTTTPGLFGPRSFFDKAVNDAKEDVARARQARSERKQQELAVEMAKIAERVAGQKNARAKIELAQRRRIELEFVANDDETYSVSDEQFMEFVYLGRSAEDIRKKLDADLAAVLTTFTRNHSLSDAQQRKLRLAGRGDINDWFDRVEKLRIATTAKPLSATELRELVNEMNSLDTLRGALFGGTSLIRKTLANMLPSEAPGRDDDEPLGKTTTRITN